LQRNGAEGLAFCNESLFVSEQSKLESESNWLRRKGDSSKKGSSSELVAFSDDAEVGGEVKKVRPQILPSAEYHEFELENEYLKTPPASRPSSTPLIQESNDSDASSTTPSLGGGKGNRKRHGSKSETNLKQLAQGGGGGSGFLFSPSKGSGGSGKGGSGKLGSGGRGWDASSSAGASGGGGGAFFRSSSMRSLHSNLALFPSASESGAAGRGISEDDGGELDDEGDVFASDARLDAMLARSQSSSRQGSRAGGTPRSASRNATDAEMFKRRQLLYSEYVQSDFNYSEFEGQSEKLLKLLNEHLKSFRASVLSEIEKMIRWRFPQLTDGENISTHVFPTHMYSRAYSHTQVLTHTSNFSFHFLTTPHPNPPPLSPLFLSLFLSCEKSSLAICNGVFIGPRLASRRILTRES